MPDPGSPDEERCDDVRKIVDGNRSRICHPDLEAGNVLRFRGLRALHPVTPPEVRRSRLCLPQGCVPDRVRLAFEDALNAVHGTRNPVLQRYFVVTPELAASVVDLLPSQRSGNFQENQEKVIFVLADRVNVYLPETFDWFELFERDVLYLPANTVHQVWNYSGRRASFAFMMVPG